MRTAAFLALMGAVLWPLEHLVPRWRPRVTPRAWLGDVGWLLLGAATLRFGVGPAFAWLGGTPLHARAGWRLGVAFLSAELMAYAIHRAMHEWPTLWVFHRVHHEPRELDWLKAWRQHPVDVGLHALAVGLPGWLLGAPLSGLAGLVLLRRLWTGLLHANVDLDFGPLEGVISTPRFHHLHHSHDPRLFNANYAGLFPWLDSLFGTRVTASEVWPAHGTEPRTQGREVEGARARRGGAAGLQGR